MEKLKVLVTDAIDKTGLKSLQDHPGVDLRYEVAPTPEKLEKALSGIGAWLVRSETKITAPWIEKAKSLRLIGRAGAGVDNIDLEAATKRGIAVINAPSANTIAACEHAFGLMLALARNIPQADADIKAGRWQRPLWIGAELAGKSLAIVGLGRIGREIARRALAFGMIVRAHDPFVSADQAKQLGVELLDLKPLLGLSDFVTLHAPASSKNKHLLNSETFAWLKAGSRLINCARGDLVEEKALAQALESGHIAGAAIDVFEKEPLPLESPLRKFSNIILTPHLGASTQEAQNKVAEEIARSVIAFCERGIAINAINLPGFDGETLKSLGDLLSLAETLGCFVGQMLDSGLQELHCAFQGDFKPAELRPLSVAALKGTLSTMLSEGVSYVNASALAAERGIKIGESAEPVCREGYRQLITVSAVTDKGPFSVSGALLSAGDPRIVKFMDLAIEAKPTGRMLVLTNRDRPGVIGQVGMLLGQEKINIADMRVGRRSTRGEALMILTVDEDISPTLRKKIEAIDGITSVRLVNL